MGVEEFDELGLLGVGRIMDVVGDENRAEAGVGEADGVEPGLEVVDTLGVGHDGGEGEKIR